ncbi:hypothetical protein NXS97_05730 [Pantoea sp. B623]|uniref:ABC-three component system protein n=1 Tax=Pantoea TaxID=53335 RepID=UPI000E274E56|nr:MULTISPECIES: ABC-three component system protein [Pantoea]MCS4493704.1 hypothetical protein [Pantoea sp. B623]MDF7786078.1 hypothetical protein [Pantoea stewartii]MDY1000637.1 ABC-three component system protein [Pantoea agglomerans]REF11510.1 hypothetical protein C7428_0714 [Pantoea ananatis]
MTIHEFIRMHAVKVNNGSGVLVHCLSDEFSYVLTAKHVVKPINKTSGSEKNVDANEDEGKVDFDNLIEHTKVITWEGNIITVIDIYPGNNDCILLKIPLVHNLPLVRFKNNQFDHKSNVIFGGFPEYRDGEKDPERRFKTYEGKAKQVDKDFYLTIEGFPPKTQIEGSSGSGVYLIVSGKPYLIGVEIEMAGPQPDEPGVVLCYDMTRFDEIVEKNNLPAILPSFLSCFSKIKANTFDYKISDEDLLRSLRNQLHQRAQHLVNNGIPKPFELLKLYDKCLIVNGQDDDAIYDLDLWSAYSEFLILHSLLNDENSVSMDYLKKIERSSRFVYSRSPDGWLKDINNIISSARKLLDHGGMLVVSSKDNSSIPIADKGYIKHLVENITLPEIDYDDVNAIDISEGIESGEVPFSFVLLGSLHNECVTRKPHLFLGKSKNQHLKILTENYADEFKKCK